MSKKLDLRKVKSEAEAQPTIESTGQVERFELVPRSVSFDISYDAPDGQIYNETLISKVLDGDGRLSKTRVFNRLTGGMVMSSLPESEQLRIDALARVMTQLERLPQWVADWIGQDNTLLGNINTILVEHESRYFRGNAQKSEDNTPKIRVRIDSPFSQDTSST